MTLQRITLLGILLASAGSLAFALTSQYMFDKEPCILCLYQRVPFAVTALLAILALRLKPVSPLIPIIIIGCGMGYLTGAGIAFYHVGVEQHWWISGCSGSLTETMNLTDLRASLMQRSEKPCDEIDFALFGISMATYNVFFSGALGLASIMAGMQISKTSKLAETTDKTDD